MVAGRLSRRRRGFWKGTRIWYAPLLRTNPRNRYFASFLAQAWRSRADIHRRQGQPAEAVASLNQSAKVLEPLAADPQVDLEVLSNLAVVNLEMSGLHREAGRPTEAAAACRKAFDIRATMTARQPSNTRYAVYLAEACLPLAELDSAAGRRESAVAARWWQGRGVSAKLPEAGANRRTRSAARLSPLPAWAR